MAGSDPSGVFVADDFRISIRSTMLMAQAQDRDQRPIFYFPQTQAKSSTTADSAGSPFDFSATPDTPIGKDPVYTGDDCDEVLVIWDAGGAGRKVLGETPFGNFDPSRLTIVALDEDYAKIQGFDRVKMSGDLYTFEAEDPVIALFEVDVHVLYVVSEDAT